MARGCAILLLWTTIGISSCTPAVAQDCFYSQRTQFENGTVVNDIKRYDCKSPPKTIIIENYKNPQFNSKYPISKSNTYKKLSNF